MHLRSLTGFRWFFALWSTGFFSLHFGGGDSSSTSNQTTNNLDKRLAFDSGVGVSADNSTVTVSTSDPAIVSRALDSVDLSQAIGAEGFTKLLESADKLFQRGETLIGQTQSAVADAWSQAQTGKAQTIDNRTLIVLAVAGAATLYAINRK